MAEESETTTSDALSPAQSIIPAYYAALGYDDERQNALFRQPPELLPNAEYVVVLSDCSHCQDFAAYINYQPNAEDGSRLMYVDLRTEAGADFYEQHLASANADHTPSLVTMRDGVPTVTATGVDEIMQARFPQRYAEIQAIDRLAIRNGIITDYATQEIMGDAPAERITATNALMEERVQQAGSPAAAIISLRSTWGAMAGIVEDEDLRDYSNAIAILTRTQQLHTIFDGEDVPAITNRNDYIQQSMLAAEAGLEAQWAAETQQPAENPSLADDGESTPEDTATVEAPAITPLTQDQLKALGSAITRLAQSGDAETIAAAEEAFASRSETNSIHANGTITNSETLAMMNLMQHASRQPQTEAESQFIAQLASLGRQLNVTGFGEAGAGDPSSPAVPLATGLESSGAER